MPTSGPAKSPAVNHAPAEIQFPYDISFVDCEPSEAVRFQIEEYLTRLNHVYDRITDCKIAVRIAHKASKNRFFHINILLDLPGKKIAVSREPETKSEHSEPHAAIRDAFHKLTRQLEDFLDVRKDHSRKARPPVALDKTASEDTIGDGE